VLTQLRSAHSCYSKDGKLLCLVVMTTAEKASANWRKTADELSKELDVPIELVLREKMMKILSEGLITNQRWDEPPSCQRSSLSPRPRLTLLAALVSSS
jgi:hypothetical protein